MYSKVKVLLVDDIQENLVALEALLRRPDVEIITATSGPAALEQILLHEFGLAFLDVQMPDMDGFELAELMRGAERSKYIPIIFVTAGSSDAHRMFLGYESGAVDFLFKPIDPHVLKHKVDTFIKLQQQKEMLARQLNRIQQSESLLRAVMDATSAVIYVKDVAGRYIAVNKQYELLFDVHPDRNPALTDYDIFSTDTADQLRRNDRRVIDSGCAIQVEECVEQDDGTHTYISSKVPLRKPSGEIWALCGVSTDVSEMKRLESQLAQAVRMREDVLAVVSHDMRNFLQAIKSGVTMLSRRNGSLDEPTQAKVRARIQTTVDLMTRMIADLMDMANIRAGRISVKAQPEPLGTLLNEAISVHEPLAAAKNIVLATSIQAADATVVCDRERILQVLANLLGNAIKFSPADTCITVTAEADAGSVNISIQDQGTGIAAADLPHVFDAYWSGKNHGQPGTGLGLYITRRIIEAHGKQIGIRSQPGAGTTVQFALAQQAG